jgi:hypothetical protein
MLRDDAPEQVGGAAGAEGHYVLDWFVGIGLLCGSSADHFADHQCETHFRGELHETDPSLFFVRNAPGRC